MQIGMLGAALTTGVMMAGCAQPTGSSVDDSYNDNNVNKDNLPYDVTIGNYTLHNFMGENPKFTGSTVNEGEGSAYAVNNVNYYLNKAETYIKGLANNLEQSLNGRPNAQNYFSNVINTLKSNRYYHIYEVRPGGQEFDKLLNVNPLPFDKIFTDIIKNLDNADEREAFELCYRVLAGESYKEGLGYYRNYSNPQMSDYNTEKEDLIYYVSNNKYLNDLDLTNIYAQNDRQAFTPITTRTDFFLNKAVSKMNSQQNLDLQVSDLQQCMNLALTCNSLGAMHDYTKGALTHKTGCVAPNSLSYFVQTMQNATREIWEAERQNQSSLSL
ncbi:MAG: hypothetical protein NC176_06835 [Treponema brennaborense]|nr:hypothetical protein [Prevotella sp.]MCM1408182.1 hypothetical protein [Treponema brennaborense]